MATFGEAIKTCLKEKYASVKGRAPRSEYWFFYLFYMIVYCVPVYIGMGLAANGSGIGTAIMGIAYVIALALMVPTICVTARRLHDIGKSGWMMLVAFIPLVGWIIMLIWLIKDSEPGDNQYGPNPKA